MLLATFDFAARRGGDQDGRFFFPFFLILLLIGGAVFLIRRRRGDGHSSRLSAMRTLQDRFARGEIDQAEFNHRRAVLDGDDVIPPAPPARPTPRASAAPPAGGDTASAPSAPTGTATAAAPDDADNEEEEPKG